MSNPVKPVTITGLREFQASLRQMDADLPKRIRVVLNEVAETVVQGARRRVPTDTGAAKASLRAASGQREAKVKAGNRKAPYYGWLDFGGRTGKGRTGKGTGSVHRPVIAGGRYLYPTYHAGRDSILKALAESLTKLAQDSGLEVND